MESLPYVPYSVRRNMELRAYDDGQILEYDVLPKRFIGQACYCLVDAIGSYQPFYDGDLARYWNWIGQPLSNDIWFRCNEQADRDNGIYQGWQGDFDPQDSYLSRLQEVESAEMALDLIETAFHYAHHFSVDPGFDKLEIMANHQGNPLAAANVLNKRFAQHNLGYRISIKGLTVEIVRIDSEYLHSEVVLPTLDGLEEPGFQGPLHEFREAIRLLNTGEYKSSMNESLKAFESTMKSICIQRGLEFDQEKDAAKQLIAILQNNNLFDRSLTDYTNNLVKILESTVPTLRNRKSGHGQGHLVTDVPEYTARYTLNLTASNIGFLLAVHAKNP